MSLNKFCSGSSVLPHLHSFLKHNILYIALFHSFTHISEVWMKLVSHVFGQNATGLHYNSLFQPWTWSCVHRSWFEVERATWLHSNFCNSCRIWNCYTSLHNCPNNNLDSDNTQLHTSFIWSKTKTPLPSKQLELWQIHNYLNMSPALCIIDLYYTLSQDCSGIASYV